MSLNNYLLHNFIIRVKELYPFRIIRIFSMKKKSIFFSSLLSHGSCFGASNNYNTSDGMRVLGLLRQHSISGSDVTNRISKYLKIFSWLCYLCAKPTLRGHLQACKSMGIITHTVLLSLERICEKHTGLLAILYI